MTAATQRFADPHTAARYPAPTTGTVAWRTDGSCTRATIELGRVPAGSIIAPSLSVLDAGPYEFGFQLTSGSACWSLPGVPSRTGGADAKKSQDPRIEGKIDCWHILEDMTDLRLESWCSAAPRRFLLTASSRALQLDSLPAAPGESVQSRQPPRYSQMLENPRIANRICSPVSLAMVLSHHHPATQRQAVISACCDPATRMYGIWPLAVRAASLHGSIGALELLTDWNLVTSCLAADLPIVASIRYARNTLPGSPQPASGGHLVVVHGVTGEHVLVNDPAAPDHGSVSRTYPLQAFADAWFRHRGAAYILLP